MTYCTGLFSISNGFTTSSVKVRGKCKVIFYDVDVIPAKFKMPKREDEEGFVTCGKLLPIIIY
jgi:hypothetical protein